MRNWVQTCRPLRWLGWGVIAGLCGGMPALGNEGMEGGAKVSGQGTGRSVRFRVWAPQVSEVGIWGDFTGSKPQRMQPDPRQPGYWIFSSAKARPGDAYRFYVNGQARRDPQARAVHAEKNEGVVVDAREFAWGAAEAGWKMPPQNELVMYEMHLGAFAEEIPGNGSAFERAAKRLSYLKGLGINCIQLMPVNEFPGSRSWGYNPGDLFAVESSYGGADDFRKFVQACHTNGIAVMLDVVHNHYGPDQIAAWDFDGSGDGAPYFYTDEERASTEWGPRPDYSRPEVRAFIADSIRMWIEEYHLDGFRWDSVHNIRYYQNGAHANADGDRMLREINDWLAQKAPGALRVAEDHAFDFGGVGFQAQWHSAFQSTLSALVRAGPAARDLEALTGELENMSWEWINFAECHDSAGDLNMHHRLPTYIDPAQPDGTRARALALLANAIVLTIPGTPMMLQGLELHETRDFSDATPLPWNQVKSHAGLVKATADLIRLRRNLKGYTAGLQGEELKVIHCDNAAKVMAWRRTSRSGTRDDSTMVVVNFSDKPLKQYGVKFPSSGTWYCHYNSGLTIYDPAFDHVGLKPNQGLRLAAGQTTMPLDLSRHSMQVFSKSGAVDATVARAAPMKEIEGRADPVEPAPIREEIEWKEEIIPPFPYIFVPLPEEFMP